MRQASAGIRRQPETTEELCSSSMPRVHMDPGARRRAVNEYVCPVQPDDIEYTSKKSSPAHAGPLKHSIDFTCPEGTQIFAAAAGHVVWVKNDSSEGGWSRKYWNAGNRIVIEHENGEYSAYEHLRYHGAKVRVGDVVKCGQLIGFSGNTGYSSGPHLHFEVFVEPKEDLSEGRTVQVSIKDLLQRPPG